MFQNKLPTLAHHYSFQFPPTKGMQKLPSAPKIQNSQQRPKKKLGPYQFSFDRKLGSGLTSDAYTGTNIQSNQQVCVKIIDRLTFKTPQQKKLTQNEISCQKKIRSEYIVQIYDVFDSNSFIFVITELCEHGDLYKLLRSTNNGLNQDLVKMFAHHIAQALKVLKNHQIIHRDIKSENILISKGKAKLGDFGFAIQKKNLLQTQKYSIGSPMYMSLEALKQKKYSYASDIFAYGVVLYEMLHREAPWQCSDEKQLINRMQTQQISFKNNLSEQIKWVIKGCLQMDIQKRLTIEQILESPLFANKSAQDQNTQVNQKNQEQQQQQSNSQTQQQKQSLAY